MSQLIISSSSGVVPVIPPEVPEEFVTDNGTAIPESNILIIHGNSSSENNDLGIIAKGGAVETGAGNQVDVVITNRLQAAVSTSENNPNSIITFFPTLVGTYVIEARIAAFNATDEIGAGYSLFATFRYDGSTCTLCGTPDKIVNEEGAMSGANVYMQTGGSTASIMVIGYIGSNISWNAVSLYTYIGA